MNTNNDKSSTNVKNSGINGCKSEREKEWCAGISEALLAQKLFLGEE